MPETIVITDTSVLINFLVLDRIEQLARLPTRRFLVTDHVRLEVSEHYSEQLQRLEQAFRTNSIEEIAVTELHEVAIFAQLTATGLGIGECSAIAVAANRHYSLAIDDLRAIKKIEKLGFKIPITKTEDLMISLIRHDILTIHEADVMKLEWEKNYRFRLNFSSFADRL